MLPSRGLMSEFGVVGECTGTLINFSPCSTFHPYPLHIPNLFTPLKPIFTRMTSLHCLGTFIAVYLALSPPPPVK
jgi:hypothetical protein